MVTFTMRTPNGPSFLRRNGCLLVILALFATIAGFILVDRAEPLFKVLGWVLLVPLLLVVAIFCVGPYVGLWEIFEESRIEARAAGYPAWVDRSLIWLSSLGILLLWVHSFNQGATFPVSMGGWLLVVGIGALFFLPAAVIGSALLLAFLATFRNVRKALLGPVVVAVILTEGLAWIYGTKLFPAHPQSWVRGIGGALVTGGTLGLFNAKAVPPRLDVYRCLRWGLYAYAAATTAYLMN